MSFAVLAMLLHAGGCERSAMVPLTVICGETPCRNADVSIDGHLVGRMIEEAPDAFFLSADVSPGPHELKVTKDGKLLYAEKFSPKDGAAEHYVLVEPEPNT